MRLGPYQKKNEWNKGRGREKANKRQGAVESNCKEVGVMEIFLPLDLTNNTEQV